MPLPRFFRKSAFLAVLLVAAVGLGSCATPPPPQFPDLRFTHLPPITLGVERVEIVDNFTPPSDPKHVENRMPVTPEQALRNWARDRLKTEGVSGVAKFIINNAAVTETELTRKKGLSGVFTTEQSHRYDAAVDVELKLEGVPRVTQAYAKASINRSQTVPEDASINVREEMWFNLTEQVMKDFDPQMSESIRKHLADFIR